MLYKRGDSVLSVNSNNKFGYEYIKYSFVDKNIIALEDFKNLESDKFVEDKVNANRMYLEYIQLVSAPKEWLLDNNFEEIPDNYGIKKKFIKK